MNIAIINDNTEQNNLIVKVFSDYKEFKLQWIATNDKIALQKFNEEKPDLIILQLNISKIDTIKLIKTLISNSPIAILVLADTNLKNQSKIFEAMGCGALDVVSPPYIDKNIIIGDKELIHKIEVLQKIIKYYENFQDTNGIPNSDITNLVVIGSSTGGPKALATIFQTIPKDTNVAFVVIQHVDSQFAEGLLEWLKSYSKLPIHIAKSGEKPKNRNIYLAGTNDHLYISKDGTFQYSEYPTEVHFRPSVDVFFNSLSINWNRKGIALILTGMGSDGAKGMLELKNKGWFTIAQDEESSIVYGMPKVAKELNATELVLPISDIAENILLNLKKVF